MYLAIYKDTKNNIIRYYYEKNRELFYDEYSKNEIKKYKLNSLEFFYKLFSKDETATFLKKDGLYDIYLDSNNYKHYIKDGVEDFIKYYENNGVTALLFDEKGNSSDKKKKTVKRLVIGAVTLIVSAQLCYHLLDYIKDAVIEHRRKEDSYEEFVSDITVTVTDEEILSGLDECLKDLDSTKVDMIKKSNIISDILPYYNDIDKTYLYEKKLTGLHVTYADSRIRRGINGVYNEASPSTIYIMEDIKDNSNFENKVFGHEFCHLLQNKNIYNYFTEPVAELLSSEYFDFTTTNYLDEVKNLKLLICTVGREPVLKYSIGGDESELLDIIKTYLPEDEYEAMKSMLSMGVLDYGNDPNKFNGQMTNLIEELYFNMYGVRFKDTVDFNLIAKEVEYDEFLLSDNKNDTYFDVLDNRLYLKEDKSGITPTITFNILENKDINNDIFVGHNIKSIDTTKYYKKKLSLEEYHYFEKYPYPKLIIDVTIDEENFCNEYFLGDDEEVYAYYMIDGKKTCLSFDEMYTMDLLAYYLINNENDIDSLEGYDFAFDTKKITVEVDPILEKYNNSNKLKK